MGLGRSPAVPAVSHQPDALVDGTVGVVVAPRGRLLLVHRLTFKGGKIAEVDAIGDPGGLSRLDLAVLPSVTASPSTSIQA